MPLPRSLVGGMGGDACRQGQLPIGKNGNAWGASAKIGNCPRFPVMIAFSWHEARSYAGSVVEQGAWPRRQAAKLRGQSPILISALKPLAFLEIGVCQRITSPLTTHHSPLTTHHSRPHATHELIHALHHRALLPLDRCERGAVNRWRPFDGGSVTGRQVQSGTRPWLPRLATRHLIASPDCEA